MKSEIKIPSMGESISTVIIGTIFTPTGTVLQADSEILEVETDKVNQPLYAPCKGEITLNVQTGDTVAIGEVMGEMLQVLRRVPPFIVLVVLNHVVVGRAEVRRAL